VASCGHLRELTSTVVENIEFPKYTIIPKKLQYVRQIKLAISECNGTILLGTDADREGEAIAWHVCEVFNLPVETTPRIVFNEITQSALEHAIRNPRFIDMNLVHSQQARQVLDMLIGYKITPLLWANQKLTNVNFKSSKKSVLSAGRCQTPALRLIYENESSSSAAIATIASSPVNDTHVYNCNAYFTGQHIPFSLSHPIEPENISTFLNHYSSASTRTPAIRHTFCGINPTDIKRITYDPPVAFKTGTLQQAASELLHLNPSETMECAQSLYERGLITYHRTDETRTSDIFRSQAGTHISNIWGQNYMQPHQEQQDRQEQERGSSCAHEAIRPINAALSADKLNVLHRGEISANECRVYHLIWRRAIQSCMIHSTCDTFTACVEATMGEKVMYRYTYNASNPVFLGWRACGGEEYEVGNHNHNNNNHNNNNTNNCESDSEKRENLYPSQFQANHKSYFNFLLNIKQGSILPHNEIKCNIGLKKTLQDVCRSRYTEGGLIRKLDVLGIGRPSTFASILHKLQKREYVVKRDIIRNTGPSYGGKNYIIHSNGTVDTIESNHAPSSSAADTFQSDNAFVFGTERNKLQLTELGRSVIETLIPKCDSVFAYDYTKKMEADLDAVALGNRDWRDVCKECLLLISTCTAATNNLVTVDDDTVSPALSPGILRVITKYTSVRDGKYGAYVFHQPPKLKKPKFISLKDFKHNALLCDIALLLEWIDEHA
jgi:DNA topoisomerase-1